MKRLAVYLDGTWNEPSSRTNVHRLHHLTADRDGEVRQLTRYWNGVGTKSLEWLRGGAFGFGTGRNIREAYGWLRDAYQDGDEIYIFGFSRGAYSARSLAGMISRCGLLRADAPTSVEQVYRQYASGDRGRTPLPGTRAVDVHFLGVWDTVGALGVPWGHIPWVSRKTLFHDTDPSPRYRNMFHALAVDEHRAAFRPTLWTSGSAGREFVLREDQRLEQRWFVGAHADVGGGSGDSGLTRIAAQWLADRARECGLVFTEPVAVRDGDQRARVSDSFAGFLHGLYRIVHRGVRYYRPIERRTSPGTGRPLHETVDPSVLDRWHGDPAYRESSPNLTQWIRERGLDAEPTPTPTSSIPAPRSAGTPVSDSTPVE